MKTILKGLTALALGLGLAGAAQAAEYPIHEPIEQSWSFAGPFGTYDRGQLQRGFQVYREACAACHGLTRVAFRNLRGLGYSEEQVIALAAEYEVEDGPDSLATCSCARPSPQIVSPLRSRIPKPPRRPITAPCRRTFR
jgi:ubiquinol-cytochrome c reductase cytochrome c1 subunit